MAENLKQTIEFQAKGIERLKGQYKDLERRTKGLEKSTKGSAGALGGLVAKLGLTTVAMYGTSRAISAVVSVGAGFEKTMSNVAAISGATGQELKALEDNAKELGSTTVFTASQVAGLQTEFAKLGFSSKEITGVTKDTLALASATGSELSVAAAVAGQTLRAFGLDVSETSTVTDTMALSFSRSALDMDKFTNSMTYVAPIAKQVGFSVEETTAILGTLANAGIDGSMAGTSLRKILLELGNENSKLSKEIGFSVKNSDDLTKAFEILSKKGIGTAKMKELVGQRAISAFNILMEGTETTKELTAALNESGGAAQQMADVQLDNFEGKVTLLNSAMEGLGITLFDFVDEPLTDLVNGITDFVQNLDEEKINKYASAVGGITIAFAGYNAAVLIARARTIQFSAALVTTGFGALVVGAGLAVGKLLEMSDAFGIMEEKAVDAKKAVDDLTEAQIAALETKIDENENKFAEQFEEGALGAKKYAEALGILAVVSASHTNAKEREKNVQEAQNMLIEKGYLKLKEVSELEIDAAANKNEKLRELTKAEQAIYQNHLSERRTIFDEDHQFELDSLETQHADLLAIYEAQGKDTTRLQEFFDKKRAQIQANDRARTAEHYSAMLTNFSSFLSGFAGSEKAAARLQQVAAVVDAYSAANQLYADPKLVALYPANQIAAAAALAAGLANAHAISKSIGEFKSAETGFDGIVDRPTMFMTGENSKAERVSITPLESPNIAGGGASGGITINVSAPLVDETVLDSILPAIERAQQMELA